jgi:hypothetical protein
MGGQGEHAVFFRDVQGFRIYPILLFGTVFRFFCLLLERVKSGKIWDESFANAETLGIFTCCSGVNRAWYNQVE